jgi:uncharacterized protein (TIGR04255 family)
MNWEPARADHSIDRAVISIMLTSPVDANALDELVVAGRKAAAAHNLTDRVDLVEPVEITPQSPQAVFEINPTMPPRRVVFRRLDANGVAVDEVSIGTQRIAVGTLRYRRWADLFALLTTTLNSLEQIYPLTQNVRATRLEYVDRFHSIPGGADHFEVIDRNSPFLPPILADKTSAFHVHSGWFEFETPNIRQLTNVHIDVTVVPIPSPPDARAAISVLSLSQFDAVGGTLDHPIERLVRQHDYLKMTFGRTITIDAANRVALND